MSNTIACILLNSKLSSILGFSLVINLKLSTEIDSVLFVSNVRYLKTHYSFSLYLRQLVQTECLTL